MRAGQTGSTRGAVVGTACEDAPATSAVVAGGGPTVPTTITTAVTARPAADESDRGDVEPAVEGAPVGPAQRPLDQVVAGAGGASMAGRRAAEQRRPDRPVVSVVISTMTGQCQR